ncbi:MAG: histidinol dehydrogenase [Candidatus Aenigmarchaeota archaeon]|nr:histidinol dehydrogenase [Candidatus Aenigmarchaeota archaeon]
MKIVTAADFKNETIETNVDMKSVLDDITLVRTKQDEGIQELTKKYDGIDITSEMILVSDEERKAAYNAVTKKELEALKNARNRIQWFCEKQRVYGWKEQTDIGEFGEIVLPVQRIGCYIPGGNYSLPSTVLMTVIPAQVAGVEEIVLCTPPRRKENRIIANEAIVVAADLLGIKKIYKVGGIQAVAALAYGTETVPKVDKIIGPGNKYVSMAKKIVYGDVDIDFLAGPTEVLIIADESANPDYIAADLIAQAEHDIDARPIVVTPSVNIAEKIILQVQKQVSTCQNREITEKSLENGGFVILATSLEECFTIANEIAPEHIELMIAGSVNYMNLIKNAGSIFLGNYSTESLGDYASGTNHVLPTNKRARTRGGLSVRDFVKVVSFQNITKNGIKKIGDTVVTLAKLESLDGHASSVKIRLKET